MILPCQSTVLDWKVCGLCPFCWGLRLFAFFPLSLLLLLWFCSHLDVRKLFLQLWWLLCVVLAFVVFLCFLVFVCPGLRRWYTYNFPFLVAMLLVARVFVSCLGFLCCCFLFPPLLLLFISVLTL